MITFEDIKKANETIITTDIKGKNYSEVNQRIKAFRMIYPMGAITTEMLSIENGVCIMKATISNENGVVLATGTAYEKEGSTFINKTSYIENCETSAVGRALGMAGFGIDTSVCSAEEVQNAINNQTVTKEEAERYVINFGKKHNGHMLTDVIANDPKFIEWCLNNSSDENLLKSIELLTGKKKATEEELNSQIELIKKMEMLMLETDVDRESFYEYFKVKSNKEMTIEQMKEAIVLLEKKKG